MRIIKIPAILLVATVGSLPLMATNVLTSLDEHSSFLSYSNNNALEESKLFSEIGYYSADSDISIDVLDFYNCADWAVDMCDYYGIDPGTAKGFAAFTAFYLACALVPPPGGGLQE